MSDVICPYCEHEQDINHDDGYGLEDGGTFEQHCTECEALFKFTTTISTRYRVYCAGEHVLAARELGRQTVDCTRCDHYERVPKV